MVCGKQREVTATIYKTAALVPELAVEDLPLDGTATLVPAFAVKILPLGRTLLMMIFIYSTYEYFYIL